MSDRSLSLHVALHNVVQRSAKSPNSTQYQSGLKGPRTTYIALSMSLRRANGCKPQSPGLQDSKLKNQDFISFAHLDRAMNCCDRK